VDAEIKNKNYVLFFIFGFIGVITVGGMIGLWHDESVYGKYWGTIIDFSSNVVLMLVGFIVGKESNEGRKTEK
ncbi:MAG: hypothetical protein PHQ03_04110, partial [Methylococcales bacterium]|nr:hypothetical protein [Methylococcales bacterium]